MQPLTEDSGIAKVSGPKAAAPLEKNKGIRTVGDLLEFVPRKYLRPNELTDLSGLSEGDPVVVVARVEQATTRPMRNRPRLAMPNFSMTVRAFLLAEPIAI